MAIAYTRYLARRSSLSIDEDGKPSLDRVYIVRSTDGSDTYFQIMSATGMAIGQTILVAGFAQPIKCKSLDCKAADDSALIFEVTGKYEVKDPEDGEDPENPNNTGLPANQWGATGSSSAVPVFMDTDGNMIKNSAGDPLEGLEKEQCEFTLTLTKAYTSHLAVGAAARTYTDTCNQAAWNGGAQHTWLCRFKSASIERKESLVYWTTSWEFAYKASTWKCMPWDVGFHEWRGSPGAGDFGRKAILGVDGKPVKQPVALAGGTALPPGQGPFVINDGQGVKVYAETNFSAEFGEMFTPVF